MAEAAKRKPKVFPPPPCCHCGQAAVVATGEEIYGPKSSSRFDKFYACWNCQAWVGCHPNGKALGRPANLETRDARIKLHPRFDRIWKGANAHYKIASKMEQVIVLNTARLRTYAYLAEIMGLSKEACHIAMFDIEQCREAWVALTGLDYGIVRKWAHDKKAEQNAETE